MLIKILEALGDYNAKIENGAIIITPSEKPKKYILEDKEYIPKDKELVWCWDNYCISRRSLCFYDATNHCAFQPTCKRNGYCYDNYAPFEEEYPQWAKDVLKLLED